MGILGGFASQHSDTAPSTLKLLVPILTSWFENRHFSGCVSASVPCKYVDKCQSQTQYPGLFIAFCNVRGGTQK